MVFKKQHTDEDILKAWEQSKTEKYPNGNKSATALIAGMTRQQTIFRLRKLGIK